MEVIQQELSEIAEKQAETQSKELTGSAALLEALIIEGAAVSGPLGAGELGPLQGIR